MFQGLMITPGMILISIFILIILIINTILLYKANHKIFGSLMVLGLLITSVSITGAIYNNFHIYSMQSTMEKELNQNHKHLKKVTHNKETNDYLVNHNHFRAYFSGTQSEIQNGGFYSATKINNRYADVYLANKSHHYQIESIELRSQ